MNAPTLPTNLRAVIFDCDGVLIQSWDATVYHFNKILEDLRLGPMTPDEEKACFIRTVPDSLAALVPPDRFPEAMQLAHDFPIDEMLKRTTLSPGIVDFLGRLADRNIRMGINTNGGSECRTILRHFGIIDSFESIITSDDVNIGKPSPEGALRLLETFDVPSQNTLFIGDGSTDQAAALAADIPFWAYDSPELEAICHFNDFAQVVWKD